MRKKSTSSNLIFKRAFIFLGVATIWAASMSLGRDINFVGASYL